MQRSTAGQLVRFTFALVLAAALAWLLACATIAAPSDQAPAGKEAAPTTAPAKPQPLKIERIPYLRARKLANLADEQIDESSGLACGRRNAGVFWTHNDSGDSATLYAFNAKGQTLATVNVAGGWNSDWEDMCSVRLGERCLLMIGDTGNNLGMARRSVLYVVPEPKLDLTKRNVRGKARCTQKIYFRFGDGWFDSEALAVDPAGRRIYLITKIRRKGQVCRVYELRWPVKPGKTIWVAKPIVTLKIPNVTALDISPDGLRAVVLTYGNAYEYVRAAKETWAQGFARPPRVLVMPRRAQGESICYGPDGKTLYLTSEQLPTPLWEIGVRAKK